MFSSIGSSMFSNIGGKIKTLATAIAVIGIGAFVLCGFIMICAGVVQSGAMVGTGLAVMILGAVLSWVGSFLTYGFGELIENVTVIAELTAKADAGKHTDA